MVIANLGSLGEREITLCSLPDSSMYIHVAGTGPKPKTFKGTFNSAALAADVVENYLKAYAQN